MSRTAWTQQQGGELTESDDTDRSSELLSSKAADRLLSGKASAAVLTLVYPETGFSAIDGYSVFRVSLDHRERM